MKSTLCTLTLLAMLSIATRASGHGAPIVLAPSSTTLSVTGGITDTGYVSRFFAEDDEEGDGEASPVEVPGVGKQLILWEVPGFNMSGLNTTSSLSLEVLAPAVADNPSEKRTIWYWNEEDGVVPASSEMYLLGTALRNQLISPDDDETLLPFLLVNQVGGTASQGGQQGFHNHNLLSYGLDNDASPAPGAYGLFVRLTSNQYAPSNPFLIVLNHGVEYESMFDAARAINDAAVTPPTGDFNMDGNIDAADYVMWRKTNGPTSDYDSWRAGFGSAAGGGAIGARVPEPGAAMLVALGAFALFARSISRRRPS